MAFFTHPTHHLGNINYSPRLLFHRDTSFFLFSFFFLASISNGTQWAGKSVKVNPQNDVVHRPIDLQQQEYGTAPIRIHHLPTTSISWASLGFGYKTKPTLGLAHHFPVQTRPRPTVGSASLRVVLCTVTFVSSAIAPFSNPNLTVCFFFSCQYH